MSFPAPPDWLKLIAATYPQLNADEQAALARIWSANYQNFQPLKSQLTPELDPDFVIDPLAPGSLGEPQA